jgi:hypothetical protein
MHRGAARWSSGSIQGIGLAVKKRGGVDRSIRGLFLLEKDEEREDGRMEPRYDGINRD